MGPAYRLTVQHLLPPTQPLPSSTSIAPFPLLTAAAPAQQPRSQPKQQQPKVKMASAANGGNDKAPGLKLLARMSKPGQGRALVGTVGGGKGGQLA